MNLNFSHPQKSGWAMAHMAHMPTRALVIHSIYRQLIVIGKYMEGKFIAGKSLHFIGCKSNQKNATIMTIQRHFGVMHVTKYVQNSILHQIKGLKLFKMVVNDLRKPDSVVVIQNYVKLFDRMGRIYGKTFIVLLVVYRR